MAGREITCPDCKSAISYISRAFGREYVGTHPDIVTLVIGMIDNIQCYHPLMSHLPQNINHLPKFEQPGNILDRLAGVEEWDE